MAAAAILKNRQIVIFLLQLERFRRNLAHWCTYHNLPWYWYCFRGRVQLDGKGRFWCAACKSVNRTCSMSTFTACTVVQAVVKANSQSNGKGQILTPWGSETPERISMKLGIYNQVAGMHTHANPCGAATTWVVWANTWKNTCCGFLGILFLNFLLYSSACAERAKVDRFWRSIRHTTCLRPRMCL